MEPQPANAQPSPRDHFTNFTEISYEKTRNSYDFSEVPHGSPYPSLSADPVPCRIDGNDRKWAEMGGISSFSAPESEALSQL